MWSKITIIVSNADQERLLAELVEWGVQALEEVEGGWIVWLDEEEKYAGLIHLLESWESPDGALSWTVEPVEDRNWNQQWEQSLKPLEIGPFFIHPTWSTVDIPKDRIELRIDPKMAFGTGYHATTHLILSWLPELVDSSVEQVLDAGTGTGLLAIAALKSGVRQAIGFDVDPVSVENALENGELNGVKDRFEVLEGDQTVVPPGKVFDLVVANINRNVLTEMIPDLLNHTRVGGTLLLSGLLDRDEAWMREALERAGQTVDEVRQREEWIALRVTVRD